MDCPVWTIGWKQVEQVECTENEGVATMMLELYGLEESIRSRRESIARDVQAAQDARAGVFRRMVGNALVHVGTVVRGTSEPKTGDAKVQA
jgi:hypothetical protein